MKLTARDKDEHMLLRLLEISDKSFDGVERPPRAIFASHFRSDDVFVDSELTPSAFAIVTERGGPYIWSIAVDPVNRGTGCGSRLLDEVIENYRDRQDIALTCKTTNVPAQILYLHKGFRAMRVMTRYYAQEGDGILMRRTL